VKPGRYAAADGSFGRSAGSTLGRGIILLAVALVIGIVLLNATDSEPPGAQVTASKPAKTSKGSTGGGGGSSSKVTTTTVPPTTTTPPHAPKDVKVIVANASTTKGAAAKASDVLKPPGYNVLAPTNGTPSAQSIVYFSPGYDRDAAAIAAALQFPPTSVKPVPAPAPVTDAKGANVIVIVGADQAARFAGAPATGATTTTAKAGTATTTTAKAGATTSTTRPGTTASTTTSVKPAATTTTTR